MKTPRSDHRQRISRFFKPLIVRIKESVRVNLRALRILRVPDLESQLGIWLLTDSAVPLEYAEIVSTMRRAVSTVHWLSRLFQAGIYPGAPFEREVLCLDMLHILVNTLTEAEVPCSFFFSPVIWSPGFVSSVISLLISSWDRTRQLAYELLLRLPNPLPGFGTEEAVIQLCEWGLTMTGSPRQVRSEKCFCIRLRACNTYTNSANQTQEP
jgi:hypothetical protein